MWMYKSDEYWNNKDIQEPEAKRILEQDDRTKKYNK